MTSRQGVLNPAQLVGVITELSLRRCVCARVCVSSLSSPPGCFNQVGSGRFVIVLSLSVEARCHPEAERRSAEASAVLDGGGPEIRRGPPPDLLASGEARVWLSAVAAFNLGELRPETQLQVV